MSQPAFQKRTRVYIACTACRKRKVKCLSDEYEQTPCERCVRKGLKCEYVPVGGEQDDYTAPESPVYPPGRSNQGGYGANQGQYYGSIPVNQGQPYPRGPPQYPPSTSPPYGTAYNTNPALGGSIPPAHRPQPPMGGGAGTYYAPHQTGYNPGSAPGQYGVPASQQQPGSSGYQANYGYPSNWPTLPQTPARPPQCRCPPGPCYCGGRRA
ncbi:hypothetical protein C8R46DRAFT_313399 [Mycena filopes]|nr:hypothetical protein C8R46DRAFT_313399 [Mycena filopes]